MSNKQSYYEKNREKILKQQQEKRNVKYEGLIEDLDFITCKECSFKSSELATHIINKHAMSVNEYKLKHNVSSVKSQKSINRVKGKNNPAYQHAGKYSPFSDKFICGTDKVEETKKKAKENKTKDKDNTQIEYYLKKTNGDLNEAQNLLTKRQSTFSLKKCIDKYGEEKGKDIWLNRQKKWHQNYKKTNFSKVSQELFWLIAEKLNSLEHIYFAQLDENKQIDLSGKNNEKTLKLDNIVCKPDLLDEAQKKIIEFNGTYWHGKVGHGNKNREQLRSNSIIKSGYKLLIIEESDYKKDKKGTIEKCLNFLNQ